eukprot:COSAG05_NODE_10077_length_584_cov_0.960825_1_plen_20_part_10
MCEFYAVQADEEHDGRSLYN